LTLPKAIHDLSFSSFSNIEIAKTATSVSKKKELFSFLAERIASLQPSNFVCSTQRENVLCNNNIDQSGIRPCIHEETNTWICIHVKHAAVHELKTSLLINTDTDVAVLAISMFERL
jgi:hypothetical protein